MSGSQYLAYIPSSLEQSICMQVSELVAVALVFTVDLSLSKPSVCCAGPAPKHNSYDLHHHCPHLQSKDPSQFSVIVLPNLSILSLLPNSVKCWPNIFHLTTHVLSTSINRQSHYPQCDLAFAHGCWEYFAVLGYSFFTTFYCYQCIIKQEISLWSKRLLPGFEV